MAAPPARLTQQGSDQQGSSLLEWVLAIAINAVVLLMLTQGLITAQHHFAATHALATLSDQGRFAQQVLIDALLDANGRMACARPVNDPSIQRMAWLDASALRAWPEAGVVGWEASGTGQSTWTLHSESLSSSSISSDVLSLFTDRVDPQSDVLLIQAWVPLTHVSVTRVAPDHLSTQTPHGLRPCSWVLASDCQNDVLFLNAQTEPRVLGWAAGACGAVPPPTPSPSAAWPSAAWPRPEHIGLYVQSQTAWFVGRSDTGQRALYRLIFDRGTDRGRVEAMVEGIETLQLEYVTKDRVDNAAWQTADQIVDWSAVAGVRYALIASAHKPSVSSKALEPVTVHLATGEVLWNPSLGPARGFGSALALPSAIMP